MFDGTESLGLLALWYLIAPSNEADVIQGHANWLAAKGAAREALDLIHRNAINLLELGEHARAIDRLLQQDQAPPRIELIPVLARELDELRTDHPAVEITGSFAATADASAHPLIEDAFSKVLEIAVEHDDASQPGRRDLEEDRGWHTGAIELCMTDNGSGFPQEEIVALGGDNETHSKDPSGL